jgi:hypothetical protein
MFPLTIALPVWLAAVLAPGGSVPASFVERGRETPHIGSMGASQLSAADLDGDGRADLVYTGVSGRTFLQVLGWTPAGYRHKQTVILERPVVRTMLVPGISPGVLVLYDNGLAEEFRGWPLARVSSFATVPAARAGFVGDVDGDGGLELLVAGFSSTSAYDLEDGALRWTVPAGGPDVTAAQLDLDPALEVVIGGTNLVIDGDSLAVDWSNPASFGIAFETGRFGAGGTVQLASRAQDATVTLYRASPWGSAWSYGTTGEARAMRAADVDGDGRDEIIQGLSHIDRAVSVIDTASRVERFRMPTIPNALYPNSIASGQMDNDAVAEIAFTHTGDALRISNTAAGVELDRVSRNGEHRIVTRGDVDADGNDELVVATTGTTIGTVQIVDANDGRVEWLSPPSMFAGDPSQIDHRRVLLTQVDADPALEIVLAGTSWGDGRIVVMDGATHLTQLQIGTSSAGPMDDQYVVDAVLQDVTGDGSDEIVVATRSNDSVSARLVGFSLEFASPPLLDSGPITAGGTGLSGLVAVQSDADSARELVLVRGGSLVAIDPVTLTVDWTLAEAAAGATLVETGVAGAELCVFRNDGRLRCFDTNTRVLLRDLAFAAPVRAVTALDGDIRSLLISAGDRMRRVDGVTGVELDATEYLGPNLAGGNGIAVSGSANDYAIVVGSEVGYFYYTLGVPDRMFSDGFEE